MMNIGTKTIAIPPGETIKEQLEIYEMTQKEFATRMDMSEKHISKLINGEVILTQDMAIRLEMVLGAPAEFWNGLEARYREKIKKVEYENTMKQDIELLKEIPFNEMSKYGWVEKTRKDAEKVINLRKFFNVVDLSKIADAEINKIACRRLEVTRKGDFCLLAIAQKARIDSRGLDIPKKDVAGLKETLEELRSSTMKDPAEGIEDVKKVLLDNGIFLDVLPGLSGGYLHGATFIESKKIVIAMTDRGKSMDVFWFSFFHEIAHIILDHVGKKEALTDADEEQADTWASNFLIPEKAYKLFLERGNYTENSIIDFAKNILIDPGIVVGRLQNDNIIGHNMHNKLKKKYMLAV